MTIRSYVRRAVRHFGYELTPVQAALPKEVRHDYEAMFRLFGEYSFKFLDIKTYLPKTINRAVALGLHKAAPLDVLDIGTGVGWFPAVCEYYGHRAVAIDQDGNQVFEDVPRWLGVDRRSWRIQSFQSIPYLGRRFDLVTAFMVNFDRLQELENASWTAREWQYFLRDLARNHLKEQGRIAMIVNTRTRDLPEVMEYFKSNGARVNGRWVVFDAIAGFLATPRGDRPEIV